MTDASGCSEAECCGCGPSPSDAESAEVEFGDHSLDPDQLAVRAAAFRILFDEGRPIGVTSVAAAADVEEAAAWEVLAGFAAKGNVRLRGDDVVGIAGLSVEPTRHRIDLAIGRRWTWCAIDAVGIVGAVGDGTIHSETENGPVELHIRGGELDSTELAVFVADGYGMTSSVDQWCPLVNFFPTLEAATAWAAQAGTPGRPVPVVGIASQAIARWRSILDHAAPRAGDESTDAYGE